MESTEKQRWIKQSLLSSCLWIPLSVIHSFINVIFNSYINSPYCDHTMSLHPKITLEYHSPTNISSGCSYLLHIVICLWGLYPACYSFISPLFLSVLPETALALYRHIRSKCCSLSILLPLRTFLSNFIPKNLFSVKGHGTHTVQNTPPCAGALSTRRLYSCKWQLTIKHILNIIPQKHNTISLITHTPRPVSIFSFDSGDRWI